jgi:hypothetical protein
MVFMPDIRQRPTTVKNDNDEDKDEGGRMKGEWYEGLVCRLQFAGCSQ